MIQDLPSLVVMRIQRRASERRLLLLSCSQRKVDSPGRIPALCRYDGPAFQVVRRYRRDVSDRLLDIYILSAEYGLIASDDAISDYDRKMDAERAAELHESSLRTLAGTVRRRRYSELFVCTSRTYLSALRGVEELHHKVSFAAPGQGKKLASLRRWLRGEKNDR